MKLTLEKVKEWSPCVESLTWAEPIWNGREEDSLVVLERLLAEKKYEWANWLIVRTMTRPQYLTYGIFAAEQVIEIFETQYPNDKRPRDAIKAAKAAFENDSAAAWDAAGAAAWAAWAATWAARAAAWAAAWAAGAAMQLKILNFGVSLLENEKEKE